MLDHIPPPNTSTPNSIQYGLREVDGIFHLSELPPGYLGGRIPKVHISNFRISEFNEALSSVSP
ncbi:hypothetical protein KbCgl_19460 [Corynebacterium glutamicum]|nr:hypothetical protein KbCgl_19460 [Corynebacterium glutamicum]